MEENNKNENIKKVQEVLKNVVKVENVTSSRGNTIPNQFIMYGQGWTLFQSYKSPIAMLKGGKTFIFKDWDYSTTTGKYRNEFLGEEKKDTLKKLKSGEYIAVDFDINLI